jgi:hypothetical protein
MTQDESKRDPKAPAAPDKAPTIWQTFASVSASFFGVQSSKNRERDFKHGKASHFIVIGILMTLGFILMVWLAVKFALRSAGM